MPEPPGEAQGDDGQEKNQTEKATFHFTDLHFVFHISICALVNECHPPCAVG